MVWTFRQLEESDFDLLHGWMNRGEVMKWYTKGSISKERIREKYLPCVRAESPKLTMIAMVDSEKIGLIQAYFLGNYPDYEAQVGLKNAVGIDLFIGEMSRMNQGLGSAMLRAFVETVLPVHFQSDTAVIGPEPTNKRAIRAYEKAGFSYYKSIDNPREAMSEYLMCRLLPKCKEKAVDMKASIEI